MSTRTGRFARLAGVSLGLVGLLATSITVPANAADEIGTTADAAYIKTATTKKPGGWTFNTFHEGFTTPSGRSDHVDGDGNLIVTGEFTEVFDGSRGQDKAEEFRDDVDVNNDPLYDITYGSLRFTNSVRGAGQSADALIDVYRPANGCPGQIENCDIFGFVAEETEEYRYPAADVVHLQYDTRATAAPEWTYGFRSNGTPKGLNPSDPVLKAEREAEWAAYVDSGLHDEANLIVDTFRNGDYDRSGADRAIFFPAQVADELMVDAPNGFHRYVATDERHAAWQLKTRSNGVDGKGTVTKFDDEHDLQSLSQGACDLGTANYCTWSQVVSFVGLRAQIATLRLGNGFPRVYDQDLATPGVQRFESKEFDTLADNFIIRMDTRGARQGYPQDASGAQEFYNDLQQRRLDEEEYHRGGGWLEPYKGWNFESHPFIAPGFQPPLNADGSVNFDAAWARATILNEGMKMTQFGAYSYGTMDGVSVDDMTDRGFYVRVTEARPRTGETTRRPIPFQKFTLRQINGAPSVAPMNFFPPVAMDRDLCKIATTDANGIGFCEFTGSEDSSELHLTDVKVQASWTGPEWNRTFNNVPETPPGATVYDTAPVSIMYGTF